MAISDKLNYLIETKQLFKDRLNSLGAEIIESTTFRNYLNWLDTFYGEVSDKTDLSINGVVGRTSQDGDPTPENPVEINNLSGDVEYKVRGQGISESFPLSLKSRNLFDKDNAKIINAGISAKVISTSQYNRLLYIPVKSSTTYTIQRRNDGNVNRFRAGTCSIVPANGVDLDNAIETDNAESITITSRENDTYLAVMYYRTQETILTEQQILDSIQIKKVDNLFDINNALNNNLYNQGTSLSLITNGIRATTEVVSNYRMGLIKIGETNKLIGKTIRVKANFFSNGNNNGRFYIGYCDASGGNRVPKSDTTTSGDTLSMVVESGSGENICLVLYSNNNGTNYTIGNYVDYKNIIMIVGDEDTTYEPYYDIELCNISDYKDRIYSQNGEFYLEKKTGMVVLDGSEDWSKSSNTSVDRFLKTSTIPKATQGISNYFSVVTSLGTSVGTFYFNEKQQVINYSTYGTTDLATFKTWLGTNKPIVYYVLATPTHTEITEENYPTLYSQLLAIQEFLTKYKINKEFLLDYSSPEIEY